MCVSACQTELQGLRPTFYSKYNKATLWKERVNTTLNWFTDDNIDVGLLYYEEPDNTGHIVGPDSEQIHQVVKMVDSMLGYLLDEIERRGLRQQVSGSKKSNREVEQKISMI